MQTVTLARNAMATRFELVLHGDRAVALRAAGEEAIGEVARLENQLSLYRPESEIAQINRRAARETVRVTAELFALLQQAQQLHAETDGAFDITVAPLVRCWGFMDASGKLPTPEAVAAAREKVGMQYVQLDAADRTVRFAREGIMLDLGAIGKGYAVECAADILREAGVTSALVHGGTSTVCAIGHPPEADAWTIAVDVAAELERRPPIRRASDASRTARANSEAGTPPARLTISLNDESLSVSAASGRQFESGGKYFGHVINPRTGQPTEAALLAAVVLGSATETDALSTALLTLGPAGLDRFADLHPSARMLVVSRDAGVISLARRGFSNFVDC